MRRFRLGLAFVVAVAGLALLPATALAAGTYRESVQGVETGFPTTCPGGSLSQFAGTAEGRIDGVFAIAVCHTSLDGSASILGGTYSVSGSQGSLSGAFTGGSVSLVDAFAYAGGLLCEQVYSVSGTLTPAGSTFTGTLVHYGVVASGSCVPYFATITGTAVIRS